MDYVDIEKERNKIIKNTSLTKTEEYILIDTYYELTQLLKNNPSDKRLIYEIKMLENYIQQE